MSEDLNYQLSEGDSFTNFDVHRAMGIALMALHSELVEQSVIPAGALSARLRALPEQDGGISIILKELASSFDQVLPRPGPFSVSP